MFDAEHENVSNYVMDELTGALVYASLEVADRRNLEFVYKELNFQMSGDVSDEAATSIGKFLGAQYVITGQLIKAGSSYRYRVSGINVETAVQESSTRLNVRDDRAFRSLLADIQQTPSVTTAVRYDEREGRPSAFAQFYKENPVYEFDVDFGRDYGGILHYYGYRPSENEFWTVLADAYFQHTENNTALDQRIKNSMRENKLTVCETSYANDYGGFNYIVNYSFDNYKTFGYVGIYLLEQSKTVGGYLDRGMLFSSRGDFELAIMEFTEAINLDGDLAPAYRSRGSAYTNTGDYDKAIVDYTQAITLDPNFAAAYFGRGYAYSGKSDNDKTITDYTQAIRLDPNYTAAYNNRGVAYYRKSDYDRAIADYSQVIRLDPNYALAYNNRGNAYKAKGNQAQADKDFAEAKRLGYAP
jgi:tetratricopeptide (TPR) repeat protein